LSGKSGAIVGSGVPTGTRLETEISVPGVETPGYYQASFGRLDPVLP
jgi:hypothetical protein